MANDKYFDSLFYYCSFYEYFVLIYFLYQKFKHIILQKL